MDTEANTTEAAGTKAKRIRKTKGDAKPKVEKVTKPAPGPKPEKAKPAKHEFETSYEGPSTVLNSRPSKTPVNFERFGTLEDAPLTDRDLKSLADLRAQFGQKQFSRMNVDAGILRRLGERGFIEHIDGSNVAPDAKFRLTRKSFSKEVQAS